VHLCASCEHDFLSKQPMMSTPARGECQTIARELRRQNQELATEIVQLDDAISMTDNILNNASALTSALQRDIEFLGYALHSVNGNLGASRSLDGGPQRRQIALIRATLHAMQANRHSPSEEHISMLMQVLRQSQEIDRCCSPDAVPPATTSSLPSDHAPHQTEWEACD